MSFRMDEISYIEQKCSDLFHWQRKYLGKPLKKSEKFKISIFWLHCKYIIADLCESMSSDEDYVYQKIISFLLMTNASILFNNYVKLPFLFYKKSFLRPLFVRNTLGLTV